MVRILIFLVFLIHGLIHLIGFLKELGFGLNNLLNGRRLITLQGSIAKVAGGVWLVACILFLSGGMLYALRKEWYWIPTSAAVIISQILIVVYWADAKYGTIANVLLVIVVVLSIGKIQFYRTYHAVSERLTNSIAQGSIVITDNGIQHLPSNVKKWLYQSNVVGKSNPNVIRVFQKGMLRLKRESDWIPFESEECFTIDPPSFVWRADIYASPFMPIGGRDKYENGAGNMVIKPLYLYPLADEKGDEINQGTLIRFLAEMMWFPQAAVSDYLQWEEIDSHNSRVTMNYKGVHASGIFTFNDEGLASEFSAQRYGDFDGKFRFETWTVSVTQYALFEGKKIGNINEVKWELKDGDFVWMKMEVKDVK